MFKRLALGGTALAVAAALTLTPAASASPLSAAPGKAANGLFRAWQAGDRTAAAKVATPAAVAKIFTYVYRAPDRFAGCAGDVCRYVHTSVRVPGGLNGIAMVVTGSKVTKVYLSRHVVKPSAAAAHLFTAWKRADRYSALEVAGTGAVKTLFKVTYDPRGVTHHWQGCSKEPKGYSCAYSYDGGAMFMHVRGSKTRGHEVRSISYIAD